MVAFDPEVWTPVLILHLTFSLPVCNVNKPQSGRREQV